MVNLLCILSFNIHREGAMETVRFHIAQMSFFLRIFFSHLVGPSEQFDTHEKLSWQERGRGVLGMLN